MAPLPPPPPRSDPHAAADLEPEGDSTGGLIPYKNPAALWAYYLGILSIVPFLGLPIGIVALVLGVMGLQARGRNPAVKGSVHAAIGIGCGGVFAIVWLVVGVLLVVALLQYRS